MHDAVIQSRKIPQRIGDLIVSPQAYARQGPLHGAFHELRRACPIGRVEAEGFDPFWAVTRHADILAVSRQHHLFRSGDRATALVPRATDDRVRALARGTPHLIRTLVHMDPPEHSAYRAVTQACFTPRSIQLLQERVRELAIESVDAMVALGQCDAAGDIVRLFPLRVMMSILGLESADAPLLLRLTESFFLGLDEDDAFAGKHALRDPARHARQLLQTFSGFRKYFGPLLEARARAPRDDVLSAIANAVVDGRPIPQAEAVSYLLILATAGHYTTSSAIAGGVWGLCQHADQFAKVKADRSLVPQLVEEAVRWTAPVQHFMRTATADTELGGCLIRKGEWLMLCYLSGSRDESVFDDPERFDIERALGTAVAFGHGIHSCLGRHLAQLEMRVFFEELLKRIDRLELAGAPRRAASIFVGGPTSVPVRF